MERIRAFVALNFALGVSDKVRGLQQELHQAAQDQRVRVGWVPSPSLHVTLKFLGEIPTENAHAIRDSLADSLQGHGTWSAELAGVGVFPAVDPSLATWQPRVIWVGLRDQGQTSALAKGVDERLGELGFEAESRPFHSHLTLGRIKEGSATFWEPWQEHSLGRFTPAEVVLYRSNLSSAGAEYTALGRVELGASSSNRDD